MVIFNLGIQVAYKHYIISFNWTSPSQNQIAFHPHWYRAYSIRVLGVSLTQIVQVSSITNPDRRSLTQYKGEAQDYSGIIPNNPGPYYGLAVISYCIAGRKASPPRPSPTDENNHSTLPGTQSSSQRYMCDISAGSKDQMRTQTDKPKDYPPYQPPRTPITI